MKKISFSLCILVFALFLGCNDDNQTTISSTHEIYYAAGGVVYVGDLPSDEVTITISDSENNEWTTNSNEEGLWRSDNALPPGTYKIEYSTSDLPVHEDVFTITTTGYYYGDTYDGYGEDIENNYVYLGQVILTEAPLEAYISPFSITLQGQESLRDGAGGQVIQYSLSEDNDIVITFNYPLWSADEICLFDSDEVPLFSDTDGDGQGDYPLCAAFDNVNSTFVFSRSVLDNAYLGKKDRPYSSYVEGTDTKTGLVADNSPVTHYLIWVGIEFEESYSNNFAFRNYGGEGMQAFSTKFGTGYILQGKVYFNVVP